MTPRPAAVAPRRTPSQSFAPPPARAPSPIVGVDFGTSYSSIALVRGGALHFACFEADEPMMPSMVSFPSPDETLVGEAARQRMGGEAQWTISSPKRLLAREASDKEVARLTGQLAFRSFAGSDRYLRLEAHGSIYSVHDVCALILRRLRERAEAQFDCPIHEAVMAAPVGFGSLQRAALERVAREAGLRSVGILSEPTAAVLAQSFPDDFCGVVAVFDFGGGTFDFSLLDVAAKEYQVRSAGGDPWLGGDDFDQALARHLADAFWRETSVDLRNRAVEWQALLMSCERAKRELSQRSSVRVELDDLLQTNAGSTGLKVRITRGEFERLTAELVQRAIDATRRVLAHANVDPSSVDAVVLTGGSALMPAVQRAVAKLFAQRPSMVDPHLAVARGTALRAAVIGGEVGADQPVGRLIREVAGRVFGAGVEGGAVITLFERDTPLPAQRRESFLTVAAGQQEMAILIYEQHTARVDESRPLGRLYVRDLPPGDAGQAAVDVVFTLDQDGVLTAETKGSREVIRTR